MKTKDNKEIKNKSSFWSNFFTVFFTLFVIAGLGFSMLTLYQKRYFGRFFVNGQSMYPTLNKDAKDKNGLLYGENYIPLQTGSYDIDYGVYDAHDRIIDSVQRFDIIICKYIEFDQSDKIKRIIALPGETFYLTNTTVGDKDNGLLYVQNKETSEFELIEQPIDSYYVNAGEYPVQYSTPYTLGENEYFVMGDNRAHSSDSRKVGPIKKTYIEGKVVALVAKCTMGRDETEQLCPTKIDYFWPRFF